MKSVAEIRDNNLCCSCGICKNVCPVNDIKYKRKNGKLVPEISDDFVSFGKCFRYVHRFSIVMKKTTCTKLWLEI